MRKIFYQTEKWHKRALSLAAFALVSLFSVSGAMAATINVTANGTIAPLQAAVNRAQAGDTIVVGDGEYRGSLSLSGKSGITIVGASKWGAQIIGSTSRAAISSWGAVSNITIKDLHIVSQAASGDEGGIKMGGNTSAGTGPRNITVEGNLVTGRGQDGIKFYGGAANIQVIGNVINGDWRQEAMDNVSIKNSLFAYNTIEGKAGFSGLTFKAGSYGVRVEGNDFNIDAPTQISVGGYGNSRLGNASQMSPEYEGSEAHHSVVTGNNIAGRNGSVRIISAHNNQITNNYIKGCNISTGKNTHMPDSITSHSNTTTPNNCDTPLEDVGAEDVPDVLPTVPGLDNGGVGGGGGSSGGSTGGLTGSYAEDAGKYDYYGGCSDVTCATLRLPNCDGSCIQTSKLQSDITNEFLKEDFILHREWLTKVVFEQHLLPALMLFTEQISTAMVDQVLAIGMFLDAKHQLETQRLLQDMTARAHKDYQPSESVCAFGTNTRSLAASEQNLTVTTAALSSRNIQRELLSGYAIGENSNVTDKAAQLAQFKSVYCNPRDNGGGLGLICTNPVAPDRMNKDVDYTATMESAMTLNLDFRPEGDDTNVTRASIIPAAEGEEAPEYTPLISPDEEDVMALSANLYAHILPPKLPQALLTTENGQINPTGTEHYMNIRAIAAKRSVATNAFNAIAAMKTPGAVEVLPYMQAILREMGIASDAELANYLGDQPSYYAQMEILTKKLYQNPVFYAELYDKPANIERKIVSMQAIDLMQQRDIYRSQLRGEAIMSVWLETALADDEERIAAEIARLTEDDSQLIDMSGE